MPDGSVERHGIGVVLTINCDTRPVQNLLRSLPEAYGRPLDSSQLHLTVIDWSETIIDVFSDRDLITQANAANKMLRHLGRMPLKEIVLPTEGEGLERYCGHLAVSVQKTEFITELRGTMGEIAEEEMGIKLSSRDFKPHVSVSRLKHKNRKLDPKGYQPSIPPRMHVSGYDVGKRRFLEHASRSRQSYANRTGRNGVM